ncbi:MAG TPA: thioredoxin domain-containing protein, partial [Gemmatimonadaceae bacterium]|nr:thioredoxin domain-containing protein [Gemmatimonadaceae bacterium]
DSIKSRREYAFRTRPDTFGARVDSQRIVRSARGDSVPWVVVFSDFQCEDCRRLALEVLPALRRDIVERGIANLAFVAAPRDGHFNARFAAIAALCAGSAGRFWPVHDSLFAALPRWERDPDPRAYMDSIAVAAGVPAERQRDCVDRNRLLRLLDGDIMRSATSRVVEVPTVFVGDQRLPSSELTLGGIRRAVEAAARSR